MQKKDLPRPDIVGKIKAAHGIPMYGAYSNMDYRSYTYLKTMTGKYNNTPKHVWSKSEILTLLPPQMAVGKRQPSETTKHRHATAQQCPDYPLTTPSCEDSIYLQMGTTLSPAYVKNAIDYDNELKLSAIK